MMMMILNHADDEYDEGDDNVIKSSNKDKKTKVTCQRSDVTTQIEKAGLLPPPL